VTLKPDAALMEFSFMIDGVDFAKVSPEKLCALLDRLKEDMAKTFEVSSQDVILDREVRELTTEEEQHVEREAALVSLHSRKMRRERHVDNRMGSGGALRASVIFSNRRVAEAVEDSAASFARGLSERLESDLDALGLSEAKVGKITSELIHMEITEAPAPGSDPATSEQLAAKMAAFAHASTSSAPSGSIAAAATASPGASSSTTAAPGASTSGSSASGGSHAIVRSAGDATVPSGKAAVDEGSSAGTTTATTAPSNSSGEATGVLNSALEYAHTLVRSFSGNSSQGKESLTTNVSTTTLPLDAFDPVKPEEAEEDSPFAFDVVMLAWFMGCSGLMLIPWAIMVCCGMLVEETGDMIASASQRSQAGAEPSLSGTAEQSGAAAATV